MFKKHYFEITVDPKVTPGGKTFCMDYEDPDTQGTTWLGPKTLLAKKGINLSNVENA